MGTRRAYPFLRAPTARKPGRKPGATARRFRAARHRDLPAMARPDVGQSPAMARYCGCIQDRSAAVRFPARGRARRARNSASQRQPLSRKGWRRVEKCRRRSGRWRAGRMPAGIRGSAAAWDRRHAETGTLSRLEGIRRGFERDARHGARRRAKSPRRPAQAATGWSCRRSRSASEGNRRIHTATTTSVPRPPSSTAPTGPSSAAVTPDSNSPS